MTTKTDLELIQQAWNSFHRIRITLLPPLIKHLNETCGISEAEYQVFIGLNTSENNQMKPSQLAQELGWDLGRLSHQISRMERKGLISRQDCPVDARSCWIGPTKKGRALFEKALPVQRKEVERLFGSALSKDQLLSLIEISRAIETNVRNRIS